MTGKFVKFSSTAGVLAPGYLNRNDLQKYDLALEEGTNWFVDYQGGLNTRPGTEFHDIVESLDFKLAPFQYGYSLSNTNLLVFTPQKLRFVQGGAYVLEGNQSINGDNGTGVFTLNSHGYENGDWLKILNNGLGRMNNTRTVQVSDKTTNTFKLKDPRTGSYIVYTWPGFGATVARIYTISTTFNAADVASIRVSQTFDAVTITSSERLFFPRKLTRIGATNWTLGTISFDNNVDFPTGLVGTGDANGTAASEVMFVVTAVDENGQESLPSRRELITGIDDYTFEQGYAKLEWNPVDGAKYYNVYRTIVAAENKLTQANNLGFVGKAYGPAFTDNNVVPDFTKTPPQSLNPFADGKITNIEVTNGGSGFTQASICNMTDGGSGTGWRGFPVVSEAGELLAVVTMNPGKDYSSPSLGVTIGTGEAFTITVGETSGNNPAVACRFQQRQIFANTENRPIGINGSKPGLYNNFDVSDIITAGDAFEFDLDADIMAPILHLKPTRSGLLICTAERLWQLTGTNGPVSAIDANAEAQSAVGSSELPPLSINEDIAILDSEYASVRLLAYSDYQKAYQSTDISILSNHYFSRFNELTSWDWFGAPHRTIIATREDGTLIVGCVVKEHEVFGWTDWETKGYARQVCKVRENRRDRCYIVVERQGYAYLESFANRVISANIENYIGSDSAVSLERNFPAGSVEPSALTGVITLQGDGTSFTSGDIGKIWRAGGGKGTVTAYTSATNVQVTLDRDIETTIPGTTQPAEFASGSWTLDDEVNEIENAWHLMGRNVDALLDGEPYQNLSVDADGHLDLPVDASRIVIGLSFTCTAKCLSLSSSEGSIEPDRKRILGVAAWLNESVGLQAGNSLSALYDFQVREVEWGLPQSLRSGLNFVSMEPIWEVAGSFYFRQNKPLPASVLGWIIDVDLGDDDER